MKILIKHVFKNIADRKFISSLIIFSISISAALLFVALSFTGSLNALAAEEFENVSIGLMLVFVMTLGMSVFVIFSSYKVIIARRLQTLGTFRSTGITKKGGMLLLLAESMLYALVSSLIAIGLGALILFIVTSSLTGKAAGISVTAPNVFITIGFALVFGFICSFFPIYSTLKLPVKDIILQNVKIKSKKSLGIFIAGITMMVVALLLALIPAFKYIDILIYITMPLIIVGTILALPYLVKKCAWLFGFAFKDSLAIKNLRNNKSSTNTVTLLVIAIALIFSINSVSLIMKKTVNETFALFNYQAIAYNIDSSEIDAVKTAAGVDDAEEIYMQQLLVGEKTSDLPRLFGLSKEQFNSYYKLNLNGNIDTLFNELEKPDKNNIIVSKDYLDRNKLKIGDSIGLRHKDEEGYVEFAIVGTVKEMMTSGNFGIVSREVYLVHFNFGYYSHVAIKTGNADEAVEAIKNSLIASDNAKVNTLQQLIKEEKKVSQNIFSVVSSVVVLSTIIGTLAILNNLIISFLNRRKSMAVLLSAGMSKKQMFKMLAAESIAVGLIAGVAAFVAAQLFSLIIPAYLVLFEFPVSMPAFQWWNPFMIIGICVGANLLASLGLVYNASKLNIVETIKGVDNDN